MGATLALWLYPAYAQAGVTFTSFALFMGAALSITAFPVLARILTDRKMQRSELGIVALACAAADDVTAWCLLAFIVGVAQAEVAGAVGTTVLAALFVLFMFVVARPLAVRWLGRYQGEQLPRGVVAWVLLALLASALATEAIGIHAVFGAFLLGAIIPHDSAVVRVFHRKLEDIVGILLLPAFFAFTGLRTEIGLVDGFGAWTLCAVIILVATLGKFGGAYVAARLTGLERRPAAALGILMNTRGLMELIVLNIGLDLGVISPALFAMMVLMALATTMATTPLLQLIVPETRQGAVTVLDKT
jgi:Kef-type K+ transport system membrane component KefB